MDLYRRWREKTATILDRQRHQPIPPHLVPIDAADFKTDLRTEAFIELPQEWEKIIKHNGYINN